MANSTTTITIGKVIEQAKQKYEELMQSDYISVGIKVDGVATRGQAQDNESLYSVQDRNSKLMTCLLEITVRRGSLIEMQETPEDVNYINKGIVTSIPNKTPVDNYFTVLFFNTTVRRIRQNPVYDTNGDIVDDNKAIVEDIPCYVERIGVRERQVDAGIDSNSVNKIIAHRSWDIKKNDILYVEENRYKVTDLEELEKDMLSAYMTFYRE